MVDGRFRSVRGSRTHRSRQPGHSRLACGGTGLMKEVTRGIATLSRRSLEEAFGDRTLQMLLQLVSAVLTQTDLEPPLLPPSLVEECQSAPGTRSRAQGAGDAGRRFAGHRRVPCFHDRACPHPRALRRSCTDMGWLSMSDFARTIRATSQRLLPAAMVCCAALAVGTPGARFSDRPLVPRSRLILLAPRASSVHNHRCNVISFMRIGIAESLAGGYTLCRLFRQRFETTRFAQDGFRALHARHDGFRSGARMN